MDLASSRFHKLRLSENWKNYRVVAVIYFFDVVIFSRMYVQDGEQMLPYRWASNNTGAVGEF